VLRTIVDKTSAIEVRAGATTKRIELPVSQGWTELSIELPAESVTEELDVAITPRAGEWVGYHLWALGRGP
jgi:hypothetical protein